MYPLTMELVEFLLGDQAGRELVKLADADLSDSLRLVTWLRKRYTQAQAAALLDQAVLRRRAVAKFPHAARMWFIDEALEQASSRAVAAYRAGFLKARGVRTVADLGCGIGADTIALAEAGLRVVAIEWDPVRARLAAANVAALGLAARVHVLCADWTQPDVTTALSAADPAAPLAVDAAFIDPARRVPNGLGDRRRVFSLHEMVPPLSAICGLQSLLPELLVKVAPGVDLDEVPAGAAVTFIAEGIQLKEAMLAFGTLVNDEPLPAGEANAGEPLAAGEANTADTSAPRRAVVLPGPHTLASSPAAQPDPDLRAPQAVLYEPSPAILRAGLVRQLGAQLDAGQIDPDIAYLTGAVAVPTPFARAWPIERHGPFNLKELNRWLRAAGVGRVIVKKRGSPIDPDTFRRRLKTTRGGPEKTIFVTQLRGAPWMLLCAEEQRSNVPTFERSNVGIRP